MRPSTRTRAPVGSARPSFAPRARVLSGSRALLLTLLRLIFPTPAPRAMSLASVAAPRLGLDAAAPFPRASRVRPLPPASRRASASVARADATRVGAPRRLESATRGRLSPPPSRRRRGPPACRAKDGDGGGSGRGGGLGGFLGGFLIGGAIAGVAGVLFAPQISKQFLRGKDAAGRFLYEDWTEDEDEDSLERTRQDLNDKIAQLNAAIDTFSAEADRGLTDKISKLNDDVEGMETALSRDERDGATGGRVDGDGDLDAKEASSGDASESDDSRDAGGGGEGTDERGPDETASKGGGVESEASAA